MTRTDRDEDIDDIRPEYEITDEDMKAAVRGKYVGRFRMPKVVRLDADVAEVFPDSQSVNQALRALITSAQGHEEAA